MSNSYFQFKQFTIQQEGCAMKVGTDGVLLGAWTDCQSAHRILDIGTGTGLIALMLAQRSEATIIGIEINECAVEQAKKNIQKSPWSSRIDIQHISFQDYLQQTTPSFDLIVSNPPYFDKSLKSPSKERSIARHTDTLTFEEILEGCKALLNENGRLCLILPFQEGKKLLSKAIIDRWYCVRETSVIPREGTAPKRLLISLSLQEGSCKYSELMIETDKRHAYSAAYIELTKDYYLKF